MKPELSFEYAKQGLENNLVKRVIIPYGYDPGDDRTVSFMANRGFTIVFATKEETDATMALRVRKDGRIFCAALRPAESGDTYIDDTLHYAMSVEHGVLVTEPMELHKNNAEWWWKNSVPEGVVVE